MTNQEFEKLNFETATLKMLVQTHAMIKTILQSKSI